MILVDTSIWIAAFRKRNAFRIEDAVEFDEITTCLPVIQEVLQGFREERAYRSARRQGLTIRSSVDCLIAACALRHDMPVLHKNRDYELLSGIAPLRVRTIS